ncbi:MAG: efflux RND transporter periplasmic adaptor subunit [Rhodanobacteraceae bacterium]
MSARRILPALAAVLASLVLAACSSEPPPSTSTGKTPDLAGITLTTRNQPAEQRWDGVVEAVQQATLTAQTNARVKALPHDVGDVVAKGDVLVRFSDVEQQSAQRSAQAQIAAARASAVNAEADYKRIREIHARGLVATSQLDQAKAARDAAQAALNAARAQSRQVGQQVDYTVVRAPYAGIVTQRFVEVGEAVQAGPPSPQKLIALESLQQLRVQVQVPQSAIDQIREGNHAQIVLGGGQRLDVARMTIYPYADPATHSFTVRLELDDAPAGLYPGMTAKVAFATGKAERLLVPASALWNQGEVTGVYLIDGATVSLRQVRTGERFGDQTEILSGLATGETIARDPAAARQYLANQHGNDGA